MKLINYNYGYNNTFDCSIHGKITMTPKEFREVNKYLFNNAVKLYLGKNVLASDIQRTERTAKGYLINIRVDATNKLVNHFKPINHDRYKQANYMLEIITK